MRHFYKVPASVLAAVIAMAPVAAQETPGQLPDGTRVPVRLMQRLSSATAKTGDTVTFVVLEDVKVGNQIVIKQGTPARGVIVEAEPKRRMGRAGKLAYSLTETMSVDRQPIRLRATQQKISGGSSVGSTAVATGAVAVFVPVAAPFVLLRKGKDLVVDEGTRVDGFVDGEHTLAALQGPVPPPQVPSEPKGVPGQKLTNRDVLNLHAAGFGDDLLIAKIENSPNDFSVEPADLVALKRAGVSERVVTTMLRRSR
jgi:hypothetical protein